MRKPSELFGKNILRFMAIRGWDQVHLAKVMGVVPQIVNRYTTERTEPKINAIQDFANALRVQPWELLIDYENDSALSVLSKEASEKIKDESEALKIALQTMAEKLESLKSKTSDPRLAPLLALLNGANDARIDGLTMIAALDNRKFTNFINAINRIKEAERIAANDHLLAPKVKVRK